ncbi:hypothetical protein BRADI_4g11530v3 [Brachypodium distachyon]|uniref:Dirigent protein n=1 Tax=Brachypodium distachyon TaxID=15368 RepID=I1IJS8_BRADI|nr:hypothetical protein BRADI_4g11530v3 [Brachypodium distachyon]
MLLALFLALALEAHPAVASARLHFYMHDVLIGPSPTAVQVLNGSKGHFSDTIVIDDVLTAVHGAVHLGVEGQPRASTRARAHLGLLRGLVGHRGWPGRHRCRGKGAGHGRWHGTVQDGQRVCVVEDCKA